VKCFIVRTENLRCGVSYTYKGRIMSPPRAKLAESAKSLVSPVRQPPSGAFDSRAGAGTPEAAVAYQRAHALTQARVMIASAFRSIVTRAFENSRSTPIDDACNAALFTAFARDR
jgi:hypothetical protein